MQIITIANQKGGVAKTTTAHLLATGLTHAKCKVLAVDCDPQTNFTFISGASNSEPTLFDLFTGDCSPQDAIIKTKAGYDLIPGDTLLLGADNSFKGYSYLRDILQPISANYDYIIIDTPPALGVLLFNALATSNSVVVPMTATAQSLQGLKQFIDAVNTVTKQPVNMGGNPFLKVSGILLTMYSDRANISRDIREWLEQQAGEMGTKLFKATIRKAVALEEVQFFQGDLFSDYPKANVTADARKFIQELTGKKVK